MEKVMESQKIAPVIAVAAWIGDGDILPVGDAVDILCIDADSAWVRHKHPGFDRIRYRSCDLADLEIK